jgi:hypothetical protein
MTATLRDVAYRYPAARDWTLRGVNVRDMSARKRWWCGPSWFSGEIAIHS